ncbi:Exosome complex exonuclease RRP44 homolog A [Zea mays]|uniref:Exosome complex exonuclease RRP44 homolog A n=1 Tax=Zea mays TaxID=4577 RepID=A0A1D6JMF9_MAIZE|nr:Exosome complex exonuclease RRP44 homolog A [Zea mays]
MLQSKSFVKKTKQGRIQKVVREHYLRDDIYCGFVPCTACAAAAERKLGAAAAAILVVDTNVVLHQIDLLENPAIEDVVLLSVVLDEVKNKNLSVFNRIKALCINKARRFYVFANEQHSFSMIVFLFEERGVQPTFSFICHYMFTFYSKNRDTYVKDMVGESSNDRNDRAIRVAARWYQSHLGESVKVLLITNDRDNKRKAIEEGLNAETVESYVRSLAQPGLLDLVVVPTSGDVSMEDVDDHRPSKKKVIYNEHKPMSEITSGLRCGIYHQGKLRVNRYNPFEAYVGSESIGDEIVIRGRSNMNRAFDGDIVAVELLPQDQWHESKSFIADDDEEEEEDVHLVPNSADDAPRNTNSTQSTVGSSAPSISSRPVGRVMGIIKRNWNSYCGSLQPMPMPAGSGGVAHALFVSKDRRVPKIRIQTRQLENLVNKRIVVAVDSWDVLSRYPSGHYVRTIGDIGDKETETEASVVLIENDINTRPFSTQVLACLPPLPWTLSPEDLANPNRQDLRQVRVFSVDPPGCRDIDDALHCTLLPNGNFEVGVHVCSLRADVERLAFSVIWEMTPDADVISTRYTKSVIKSCAAMSYVEAQARMDDSRLVDPLTVDLRNLNSLAKIMRQRRCERGALTLASAEVKFEIDSETHDPLDIGIYQIREANQMIEEFMLAANVSVAEKILKHFPLCSLLRRHPSPTKEMLEPLLRTASSIGLNLDVSSSKALAESLDNAKVRPLCIILLFGCFIILHSKL